MDKAIRRVPRQLAGGFGEPAAAAAHPRRHSRTLRRPLHARASAARRRTRTCGSVLRTAQSLGTVSYRGVPSAICLRASLRSRLESRSM